MERFFPRGAQPRLSALAKNALRTEYKLWEPSKQSMDDGAFNALATFEMWCAISEGQIEKIKFYVSEGLNTNVVVKGSCGSFTFHDCALLAASNTTERWLKDSCTQIANFFGGLGPTQAPRIDMEVIAYGSMDSGYFDVFHRCLGRFYMIRNQGGKITVIELSPDGEKGS